MTYKIYSSGDRYSKYPQCTVPKVGYYWGLADIRWERIQVYDLPTENGSTGSAGSEHYQDYYGVSKPYERSVALTHYKVIVGDFDTLKELKQSAPPCLDRQTLLDYGISSLWIDQVVPLKD